MPIAMDMTWAGVTPDQYDAVRELVGWERDAPDGGVFHAAWFTSDGLRVLDVWETAEHFRRFVDERLMPGVKQLGIGGEPEVQITPAHAVFAPAYERA